ncbi:MAG UNVERIFIED_CONTAM: DUF1585 domain-containing protein [Planctomycetaceae bacterium]
MCGSARPSSTGLRRNHRPTSIRSNQSRQQAPESRSASELKLTRQTPAAAACHRTIDPLGLAFDEYDAVGQWRTRELVPTGVGENPLVDASGEMPDGRSFSNAVQFRKLLLEDRGQIARAFIEHLCTYALRRVLTVDDQEDLKRIETEAGKSDYRVRDIICAVALSDLLRKR